jgi:hypothetical protein
MGRLAAGGRLDLLPRLRGLASDPRWRVREGVVMGLQRIGDVDMDRLLAEMEAWAHGSPVDQVIAENRELKRAVARAQQGAGDGLSQATRALSGVQRRVSQALASGAGGGRRGRGAPAAAEGYRSRGAGVAAGDARQGEGGEGGEEGSWRRVGQPLWSKASRELGSSVPSLDIKVFLRYC